MYDTFCDKSQERSYEDVEIVTNNVQRDGQRLFIRKHRTHDKTKDTKRNPKMFTQDMLSKSYELFKDNCVSWKLDNGLVSAEMNFEAIKQALTKLNLVNTKSVIVAFDYNKSSFLYVDTVNDEVVKVNDLY